MAKTINCAFCGKEIKKGMFTGDAAELKIADDVTLDCCEECRAERKKMAKLLAPRFTVKLANYKWENRAKPDKEAIAQMYNEYVEDVSAHLLKTADCEPTDKGPFFVYDREGHFGWFERRVGFMGSDATTSDKLATVKVVGSDLFGFTKDDISCIEYRLCNGQFLGIFKQAFSVEIRLNHETPLTFKPCYGKSVAIGGGLLFGYKGHARKKALKMLYSFKKVIGSELPIVEVKKWR